MASMAVSRGWSTILSCQRYLRKNAVPLISLRWLKREGRYLPEYKHLLGDEEPRFPLELPIPDGSSYEETTHLPGDKDFLSVRKVTVTNAKELKNFPGFDVLVKDEKQETPYIWRKADISEALKRFISIVDRTRGGSPERRGQKAGDPLDMLSGTFKTSVRDSQQAPVVVPRIKGVVSMSPRELNLKLNFLRTQGLDNNELCKVVSEWPKLLNENLYTLQRRINFLYDLGYTSKMILMVFKKAGRAFCLPLEKDLEKQISDMMTLAVSPGLSRRDVIDMIQRCPSILMNQSPDRYHEKVLYLRKQIGFTRQQVRNMLMRLPALLTTKNESIKEKTEYCQQVLGITRSNIARCPRVFQSSLQRLQERYAFLQKKNLLDFDNEISDYGLGLIATAPDKIFATEIGKCTLHEYEDFIAKFRREQAIALQKGRANTVKTADI